MLGPGVSLFVLQRYEVAMVECSLRWLYQWIHPKIAIRACARVANGGRSSSSIPREPPSWGA